MPKFSFWYSEESAYKVWFEAPDKETAAQMIDALFSFEDDRAIDELPGFFQKLKSVDSGWSPETLEEIEPNE